MPFPFLNYPIAGTLVDGAGIIVTVTNVTTSDSDTYTCGSDRRYLIDISDPTTFPNGYSDNDEITVSAPSYISKTAHVIMGNSGQILNLSNAEEESIINPPFNLIPESFISTIAENIITSWFNMRRKRS